MEAGLQGHPKEKQLGAIVQSQNGLDWGEALEDHQSHRLPWAEMSFTR